MDISGLTIGGAVGASLFKPFVLQQGTSGSNLLRGVLFLANDGGSPANDKLYAFFSVGGASITTTNDPLEVYDFGTLKGRPAYLDMTVDHDLIYLVGEDTEDAPNKIEKLIRYAGSSGGWVSADWDSKSPKRVTIVDDDTESAATPVDDKECGFLLPNKKYGFCYRFVYPEQGFVGPLSPIQEIGTGAVGAEQCYIRLTSEELNPPTGYGDIFNRAIVQVFRTTDVTFDVDTGQSVRGNMYLEVEFEVPRETGTRTGVYDTNTEYTPAAGGTDAFIVSSVDISDTDIVAGDIIYLCHPCKTRHSDGSSGSKKDYGWTVYRRTVTSVDDGNSYIYFDRDLAGTGVTPAYTGVEEGLFWISKQGDGVDTTGAFIELATDNAHHKPSVYIGWAADAGSAGSDTPEGLQDDALIMMPRLTAKEFAIFSADGNPRAKFIQEYEGFFVYVTSASKEAGGYDVIRWGDVDLPRKGLISVLNRRVLPSLADAVTGLVEADPFLVILMDNKIQRLHRSGGRLASDIIHNRFGSLAADAAVVVGTNMYIPSPSGILLVDLTSGQVDALNATQHFFGEGTSGDGVTGNWRGDLADLQGAYDAQLGALIFLNPNKNEMLIVWLNHGVLTHHIDVPFDRLISTGDLKAGGLKKALFFNDTTRRFYEIDADRSAVSRTTFSYTGESGLTYNGTTTADTALKLTDSAATFSDQMVGHFVRVRQSSGLWKRALIKAKDSATVLSIGANIANATGRVYAIGGVPMQVTMAPLSGHPEEPVLDLFTVKQVTAMGAAYANKGPSGRTLNSAWDLTTYQLFERDHTLATATAAASHVVAAEQAIDDDENAENFQAIQRNHSILVPGLEIWCSNLDLDLLGVIVQGKIGRSLKDTRPA
jgi:hypothetical protein